MFNLYKIPLNFENNKLNKGDLIIIVCSSLKSSQVANWINEKIDNAAKAGDLPYNDKPLKVKASDIEAADPEVVQIEIPVIDLFPYLTFTGYSWE